MYDEDEDVAADGFQVSDDLDLEDDVDSLAKLEIEEEDDDPESRYH